MARARRGTLERRRSALRALAALAAGATVGAVAPRARAAEAYPSRGVRIVVPQATGGTTDLIGRLFADELEPALGVPFIVENKAGGSGVIGCEAVAHAPPDGYTLLVATSNSHAMLPHVHARLPYDTLADFAPVVGLASSTALVLVRASLPVTTLRELIDYARAHPGELNYASAGVGSSPHFTTEWFRTIAGIELVHVPYRGSMQGYHAIRTGEVQLVLGSVGASLPLVRAGDVRALAILDERRSPLWPDVPTAAQAGLDGIVLRLWTGLMAPTGTPADAIGRLNRECNALLAKPSVRGWLVARGLDPIGGTPEAFDRTLRAEYARWGALAPNIGIRPQ